MSIAIEWNKEDLGLMAKSCEFYYGIFTLTIQFVSFT